MLLVNDFGTLLGAYGIDIDKNLSISPATWGWPGW